MSTEFSRIIEEEKRTPRFCTNCGKFVYIQLHSCAYPVILFSCPICGETLLRKEKVILTKKEY